MGFHLEQKNKCTFALLDVQTLQANKEINDVRKKGKFVKVVITGYLQDRDWGDYDGTSTEQGVDVVSVKARTVSKLPKGLL